MPFFQNPFSKDFKASLVLGDRQYSQDFNIPAHQGRGDDVVVASGSGNFNFSGNDTDGNPSNILTIWYSFRNTTSRLNAINNVVPSDSNSTFDRWTALRINVAASAASTSSVANNDVINALNSTMWAPNTSYVVGQLVCPTTSNGYYYQCTVAGTSGSIQPTWPTSASGTVTDGAGALYQGSVVSGGIFAGTPTYGSGGGPTSHFGQGSLAPQVGPVTTAPLTWTNMGSGTTFIAAGGVGTVVTAPPLTSFSSYFTASGQNQAGTSVMTVIRAKLPSTDFRFYVQNGGAEEQMLFNAKAGVAELPAYFTRHQVSNQFNGSYNTVGYLTMNNTVSPLWSTMSAFDSYWANTSLPVVQTVRVNFPDACNAIVSLFPFDPIVCPYGRKVDQGVVTRAVVIPNNAVLSTSAPNPDWKLLRGKSGLFTFQKIFLSGDGNYNIVQIIEYPAGAKPGDLGRITKYYRNSRANPYQITEEPYVLTTNDLIQPTLDNATTSWGS